MIYCKTSALNSHPMRLKGFSNSIMIQKQLQVCYYFSQCHPPLAPWCMVSNCSHLICDFISIADHPGRQRQLSVTEKYQVSEQQGGNTVFLVEFCFSFIFSNYFCSDLRLHPDLEGVFSRSACCCFQRALQKQAIPVVSSARHMLACFYVDSC